MRDEHRCTSAWLIRRFWTTPRVLPVSLPPPFPLTLPTIPRPSPRPTPFPLSLLPLVETGQREGECVSGGEGKGGATARDRWEGEGRGPGRGWGGGGGEAGNKNGETQARMDSGKGVCHHVPPKTATQVRQDRGGRRFICRISRTASNSRGSGVRVNHNPPGGETMRPTGNSPELTGTCPPPGRRSPGSRT